MTPAVEIKGLYKRYAGGVEALKGIDLVVGQGEFFGLLGPNGAGKTTTIGVTTGLVRITEGSVRVMGYDVVSQFRQARQLIGLAAQELNFDWFFSLWDLMILQAGYYGVPAKIARKNAGRLLEEFGLSAKRDVKVRALSGGMKRRFQIARSLVHEPQLVIMDEPTAGVDVELRHMLWDYLRRLNKEGRTIILTTHYIEEAELLCERVAIIDNGRIIADGSPAQLMAGIKRDGLSITVEGWSDQAAAGLDGYDYTFKDGRLRIKVVQPERRLADIVTRIAATGAVVNDVTIDHASLEDVFIELTGRRMDD
ncbi:MAG: ABC transporter ATP-binding protein [Candidatus Marinimicrobia bacterium]|nr:ABC transporter ATP-binding protein [Candidatus Neomarinimicrobiota bacterium]